MAEYTEAETRYGELLKTWWQMPAKLRASPKRKRQMMHRAVRAFGYVGLKQWGKDYG